MNNHLTKICCCIALLVFVLISSAQQVKIIAASNGAELPFATIINYTNGKLIWANANGMALLTAQNGDSIAISYVGYKTASFIFNAEKAQTIHLLKDTQLSAPVTVIKCRKMKQFKYSNKDNVNYIMDNGNKTIFDGLSWWGTIWKNSKWAVRLNPEEQNTKLKSFSFWLEKSYFGPKSAFKAPLIIDFYDVTDSILPGKLLAENPLIYYPQKTGKQTLNLDSFHLNIPPNGIYVGIECVANEEYAWSMTLKVKDSTVPVSHDADTAKRGVGADSTNVPNITETKLIFTGKDTLITCYGGRIDGVYSKNFELATFNPVKNQWHGWSRKSKEKNDLHGSVKCEAVLEYCDE